MNRAMHHLCLYAGAALFGVGCAPVGDPSEPGPTATLAAPEPSDPAPAPAPTAGVKERVEAALRQVRQRDLLTSHSFWTVFHGILGMGPEAVLVDPQGRRVNAVDYIRRGGAVRGMQFLPTRHGLDVRTGPVFVGQGHQDQFAAEMVQWGMPPDTAFLVDGKGYTFADFVRHTQARASVKADQELSWALLVIGQYVGTDAAWTNSAGEELRFEDLVRYELDQPVETGPCGGTHRLFGLTWVSHLHLQKGGRVAGVWKEVADKEAHYQALARKFQNADGSFSTNYLSGPGDARDVQLRIGSTGHVLEWLALSLPDGELRSSWMERAAGALAVLILDSQDAPVDGGALYHAAHGLQLYHDRVFGPEPGRRHPLIPLPPEQLPPPGSP